MKNFFNRTLVGKAMRACAHNRDAARLVGVNVKKMVTLSFAISAGIGAVAGIVISPVAPIDYQRGAMLALKGFGAAILGGLGSGPGAVIAGLLIGVLESLGAGYISSHYKDAIALIVLGRRLSDTRMRHISTCRGVGPHHQCPLWEQPDEKLVATEKEGIFRLTGFRVRGHSATE